MSHPLALGRYALAAYRSHPAKLARMRPATAHPLIAAALGGTVDASATSGLQPHLPPRKDQGQCGGCTSASGTGGVEARASYAGRPPVGKLSARELYAATRAYARAQAQPVGTLGKLTDSGAQLADVLAVLATVGVSPYRGPTPDGREFDIWTAADVAGMPSPPLENVNAEPELGQLEQAAADPLAGATTIDPVAAGAVDQAAASLRAGLPLLTAFLCDGAFQSLGAGDVAVPANTADPGAGGHAVFLADLRVNALGLYEFLLVNSWSAGWALDGTVWVSTAWLQATWEIHPLDEALIAGRVSS